MLKYRFKDAFLVALDDGLTMVSTDTFTILLMAQTEPVNRPSDSYPGLPQRLAAHPICQDSNLGERDNVRESSVDDHQRGLG